MYELQQSTADSVSTGRRGMSFAVGAIVGAGIALLLAPATGRDTRRRLGTTAKRVGTQAKDVIGKARGTIEGVREDARAAMQRGRESFTRASHEPHSGWQPQAGRV